MNNLLCENLTNPIGLDITHPTFSWQLVGDKRGLVQTAYVLALNFDMLPEDKRTDAAKRLMANIKEYDSHLTTGFLGTPYLCDVLTRFGYLDIAYTLLLQDTYPSWLYPVNMGATTIWERWDGIKQDGTFQTPDMNSFNHYAYGSIGAWMYRVVAGINTDDQAAGYKNIIIKPRIGGGLTYAGADLQTYYGKVSSHWKSENGKLKMEVEIPANTVATIYIPAHNEANVTESGIPLTASKDIRMLDSEDTDFLMVQVGSGKYQFLIN